MTTITSHNFLSAWLTVVNSTKEVLVKEWRNARTFTNIIKSNDDCIIKQVADILKLRCYSNDYYSIDTILYTEDDLVPKIRENTFWFRQIKVAFEHENNFNGGLFQEVAHLLITNSDLKVLVTYPNCDMTNQLVYLHEIIKGCKIQKELSDKESFLLIFGYETEFEWEAFVYKENEWKQVR